jgi:tetratricopeptide (TPR) repeat protein
MADAQRIDPEKIGSPFQLLAASLVFIVLLDGTFLSSAAVIDRPDWASGALVLAAIINVPLLLGGAFVLQTRFRGQLLGDEQFVEWFTLQLKKTNDEVGVDLSAVFMPEAMVNIQPDERQRIEIYGDGLQRAIDDRAVRRLLHADTVAKARLELGRGAAARQEWSEAAAHFESYLETEPDDWEVWFALGTAYANARGNDRTNKRSLAALDKAIELFRTPDDPLLHIRMRSYRAALRKRLGHLDEAERELNEIREDAPAGSYEADDINYNLACIYAMTARPAASVDALASIADERFVLAAAAHQRDYFAALANDEGFHEIVDAALTAAARPPRRSA